MNSLRTLQALNQVVNHDICPQMKALIAENKRLVAKNNRCIKANKSAKSSALHLYKMNKVLREENNELFEWKDYMLHMDYFRCVDCKNICACGDDDEADADGESIRCGDCVFQIQEQSPAEEAFHNLVEFDVSPATMLQILQNEPDIDMENDPRFEYDEEDDGYIYIGQVV